jgi:NAD(P)-dependent dehydrogenase (short-subunit alcohol dehydrogenase family)
MNAFSGKVAVITGAASGIGRALAERAAHEGMKVVLADIEEAALDRAAEEMRAGGDTVLPVLTDVSRADDVEALAQSTLDAFGAVHLLCNNAGVGAMGSSWGTSQTDWKWTIDVNLWGVVYGVRTFVPPMLAQGEPCHIVNTASIAGLMAFHPCSAAYLVTKQAVVGLSEQLYHELALRGAQIGVTVLCPGMVDTRIMDCARNHPLRAEDPAAGTSSDGPIAAAAESLRERVRNGMPPAEVAAAVFQAIRDEQLYLLPHGVSDHVRARFECILQGRNPQVDTP